MSDQAVIITIFSQKISFWAGVAKILAQNHRVVIPSRSDVRAVIARLEPQLVPNVIDIDALLRDIGSQAFDVIAEARRLESTYGVRLSVLLSERRDLGKGYLFNADRHPYMESAWWGHETKLREVINDFFYYETILERYDPVSFWLGESGSMIPYLVCGSRGVLYAALGKIKYGKRFCWNDAPHYQCDRLIRKMTEYVCKGTGSKSGEADFVQEKLSAHRDAQLKISRTAAVKQIGQMALEQARHKIKRGLLAALGKPLPQKHGYRYMGWAGPVWRRKSMLDYFQHHGARPEDVRRYRLVFFPMHMEPEVALMCVSPEFTNSLELVTWVSKALPADCLLIVKENIHSFGVRSKRYYDNFRMIGNVLLAHPGVSSWEWIKSSKIVTTITGTASIEAIYFNRPVLSYGKHQAVNLLPVVRYASNYDTTLSGIEDLLDIDPDDPAFAISRRALYRAQMESSFEMPDVPGLLNHSKMCMENSRAALSNLQEHYPFIQIGPSKDK